MCSLTDACFGNLSSQDLWKNFVNAAEVLMSSHVVSAQKRVSAVCEVLPINAIIEL